MLNLLHAVSDPEFTERDFRNSRSTMSKHIEETVGGVGIDGKAERAKRVGELVSIQSTIEVGIYVTEDVRSLREGLLKMRGEIGRRDQRQATVVRIGIIVSRRSPVLRHIRVGTRRSTTRRSTIRGRSRGG